MYLHPIASWGQSMETNPPASSANNLTRFGVTKQTSLPAQPTCYSQTHISPCQSSTPPQRPQRFGREYSPSMDINANFTDDDLDDSVYNSPEMTFRIHDTSPRQELTPPEQSRPRRCVSWSDYPIGNVSPSKISSGISMHEYQSSFTPYTTTFKKMASVTPPSKPSMNSETDSTPSWFRVRSATVGSRVSLKELWQKIDEENVPDLSAFDEVKTKTTWAQSTHQQKVVDVEKNSVGCQASDFPLQEPFRPTLIKCDSFDSMLAQNGLHQSVMNGLSCYADMRPSFSEHAPWFTRPRSKTFLSLHKDSVRTLQNVRDVKYEPKVKTWLVDCNQTTPSRVTCEELFTNEQRPQRRLVRIENITDASDVKYIRHRPLKPIHVVDAEYKRRKGGLAWFLSCWHGYFGYA